MMMMIKFREVPRGSATYKGLKNAVLKLEPFAKGDGRENVNVRQKLIMLKKRGFELLNCIHLLKIGRIRMPPPPLCN